MHYKGAIRQHHFPHRIYLKNLKMMILWALIVLINNNACIYGRQLEHNNPAVPVMSAASRFLLESAPAKTPLLEEGTRWALLVAGSRGYVNYRHQADVCHAFQILKKGGLRDENMIVFMYDDIAFNENNPRPGVIINSPGGHDVYGGVPKDYTGINATVENLYAVILGNKSGVTGGSGKVLGSGPNDHVFIFYTDHGSPGVIEMPCDEVVYADDLINVLKRKHQANAYKSMVFYLEACESGSMFEGLLPKSLNIYAITASNSTEPSMATYCPDYNHTSTTSYEYDVCLGDAFSVSWMEDSEKHDLRSETLGHQFQVVKSRTAVETPDGGSHVMQYGNTLLSKEILYTYMGTTIIPNDTYTWEGAAPPTLKSVSQWEADLLHYKHKLFKAPKDSTVRLQAQKQLLEEINSRMLVDNRVNQITTFLLGTQRDISMLHTARPKGMPLVDDWTCLKTMVKVYEENCGSLSRYGMKHMRTFANMCNARITVKEMNAAAARICK
ncbi:hypothetical protein ABFX02_09G128051 [Erythranthe guttata]